MRRDLTSRVVRVAHRHPETRKELVPVLRKCAAEEWDDVVKRDEKLLDAITRVLADEIRKPLSRKEILKRLQQNEGRTFVDIHLGEDPVSVDQFLGVALAALKRRGHAQTYQRGWILDFGYRKILDGRW